MQRTRAVSGLNCEPRAQLVRRLHSWPEAAGHLGEQLLHVDAGADEEVAEGEGDDGERDGGGQVRAAVLGQQLLGLVRPRLLPLASLFLLGAEHLQPRRAQHNSLSSHVLRTEAET